MNVDIAKPSIIPFSVNLQPGFEAIPLAYVVISPDEEFRVLGMTNEYLRLTGTKRDELLGRGLFDIFPESIPDKQKEIVLANKQAIRTAWEQKRIQHVPLQRYDIPSPGDEALGVERGASGFKKSYWTSSNHPVCDAEGNVLYVLQHVEDVSESILTPPESSEKTRQSQRLEAMGQLAGGVAHDFNNILAIIMMKCDLMLQKLSLEQASYQSFEQIKKTSERAARLTRQLLAFSRQQVLQPRALNINAVVKDLENILSRLLTEDISLKTKLNENLGNTLADAGQIEQIILNLVVNARDAMPKGGRITIETEQLRLEKPLTSAMLRAEAGDYILLTVRDTGLGMDAATQARIFEPFYTTKGLGKGTGLGLSTVYGIVNQSKGTIWVYSQPGQGTTFKIYLPVTTEVLETAAVAELRPLSTFNTENILVVEDQKDLRDLICESLKNGGYKVFEAENGAQALEMAQQRLRFDLIVTDVIMPEMGGKELGEKVQRLFPETRLLYMSGYTEETLTSHGISGNHPHFLEKPFSLKLLLEKVRLVLT